MAILKKDYELSVWDEVLGEKGQKEEIKRIIIGAHNMDFLGRATNLKLTEELKGTHTLTFQMPSKYFDSKLGEYVHNEFCDYLANEKKLKLKYKDKWYEFYIKTVTENKQYKSIMYQYSCEDAFIDELSRNGYGITFDTELYNNVEELGVFNEQILEDSIWQYDASKNIGDFTEYSEEKLFKIPIKMFGGTISGYKLNYQLKTYENVDKNGNKIEDNKLKNVFTGEERFVEMGDDLAREQKQFWDSGKFDYGINLLNNKIEKIPNDGYIYIPYSQLSFCYEKSELSKNSYAATEEPKVDTINGVTSYLLAPTTLDPSSLIQFIAIPENAEVNIDEAGLLVNKDYSYVMTVQDWNKIVSGNYYYNIEEHILKENLNISNEKQKEIWLKVVTYEGYLEDINKVEVTFGKKISITDRTEINISEEIDQYVTVYGDYDDTIDKDTFTNPEEWKEGNELSPLDKYRLCSYKDTRVIVPQLARNLIQNGTNIADTSGWEVMKVSDILGSTTGKVEVNLVESNDDNEIKETNGLKLVASAKALDTFSHKDKDKKETLMKVYNYFSSADPEIKLDIPIKIKEGEKIDEKAGEIYSKSNDYKDYNTFLNFGIIGQEEILKKGQTYVLYLDAETFSTGSEVINKNALNYCSVVIGEGDLDSYGNYIISENNRITFNFLPKNVNVENNKIESNKIFVDNYSKNVNKNFTTENLNNIYKKYPNLNFGNYYFFRVDKDIKNPYFGIILYPYKAYYEEVNTSTQDNSETSDENELKLYSEQEYNTLYLKNAMLFKAYTKGIDFFTNAVYRYTGRDIFCSSGINTDWKTHTNSETKKDIKYRKTNENEFLLETDIIPGDSYEYNRYFVQQLNIKGENLSKDTFGLKSYLNNEVEKNALNPTEYSEEEYEVITNYIDLNKCFYYKGNTSSEEADCKYKSTKGIGEDGICLYQKYGYCPYLFKTQKHCRKIRTLNGEKSNRFNLTQELSKVFEVYPVYYTEHTENGKVITDLVDEKDNIITEENYNKKAYKKMRKKVFYMTEKGMENKLGFRYEKNLSNISRTLDSKEIVTKLYVEDVDSELSKTGLCSIKTAEDNPSKDSYIIDFSYYILKGMLDGDMVNNDLYGKNDEDMGYLKQLGYYNTEYDKLSNKIINLQDESYTELTANIEVNLTGIETAQQELGKILKKLNQYGQPKKNGEGEVKSVLEESDTYKSYKIKYNEQKNILLGLIESTFFTNGECIRLTDNTGKPTTEVINSLTPSSFLEIIDGTIGFKKFKEQYLDTFMYTKCGMMGQYVDEYTQIKNWKKERAGYLEKINKLSLDFFQKYEPYLKEGTWSDSNYLSDNSYYFGAKEVAKQGSIPKVTYNIAVTDLEVLDSDYTFNIADTTYIEDIETFGANNKTGLPNRLKVIISGITYDLDNPMQNDIKIQNYTSQFEDLFQQVSASVQSLSFNENIYKRSSNFTATKNVEGDSLQGALDENQLTLLETDEQNLSIDYTGQSGSDINNHNNKYKLDGQGLFFSNDGGETWNVGVTPKGINADYIKVGSLDATKVQIVDGNYLYFLWDKTGITAYRTPQATAAEDKDGKTPTYFEDFARFNKYGLSLVENGKIRLRAGYNYNYIGSTGDANSGKVGEYEEDISTDSTIGFFLYNNNGQVIFSTETGSILKKDGESDEEYKARQRQMTARLSLTGEIFVTDTRLSSESKGNIVGNRYEVELTNGYHFIQNNAYMYSEQTFNENSENYKLIYTDDNIEIEEAIAGSYGKTRKIIKSCDTKISNYQDIEEIPSSTISYGFIGNKFYYGTVKNYYFTVKIVTKIFDENGQEETDKKTEEEENLIITSTAAHLLPATKKYLIPSGSKKVNCLQGTLKSTETSWSNSKNIPNKQSITYYDCTGTYSEKSSITKSLYPFTYSGNYNYWEKYELTDTTASIEDSSAELTEAIGLFINNKISLEQETTQEDPEISKRIFSCIIATSESSEDSEDSDTTKANKENNSSAGLIKRNILSILKNGQLLIGGTVEGPDGDLTNTLINNIPDEIKIVDPQILMTQDGTIRMDFDKFENMQGQSLSETISSAIASIKLQNHNHDMNTWKIESDKNSGNDVKFIYSLICNGNMNWNNSITGSAPSTAAQELSTKLAWINLNQEFFKNKTEAELKKFIFSGFGTVEKNAFEKNSSIVKIPIFDVMYKASGTTGNRGGGSSSTATTGYYLTDPLQV